MSSRSRPKPKKKRAPVPSNKFKKGYSATMTFQSGKTINMASLSKIILDKWTGLEAEQSNDSQNENFLSTKGAVAYNVSDAHSSNAVAYNVSVNTTRDDISISEPFDPTQVRVTFKEFPIALILQRIDRGELELNPEFQRAANIWNDEAQSRLIESILIRIPIPVFYIDGSEEDKWIVVDGLQRLNTFKRFALEKKLKLKNLEFLTNLNGFSFDELPRGLQRRILESSIGFYLIEKGTPSRVKLSIFQRINTGGLPLSNQEIRHALHQGPATELLNKLVKKEIFLEATAKSIGEERMADRECVLRSLAFIITPYQEYAIKNMDGFLNEAMVKIEKMTNNERLNLEHRFERSLGSAYEIFSKQTFRKPSTSKKVNPINKSLFEVWSVTLDKLRDRDLNHLKKNRKLIQDKFLDLIADKDFEASITISTDDVKKVQKRFQEIENLIKGVLSVKSTQS